MAEQDLTECLETHQRRNEAEYRDVHNHVQYLD